VVAGVAAQNDGADVPDVPMNLEPKT
jgi:hypothetical protein